MYNKLPIKSREDIDIKGSEIASVYGSGKVVGEKLAEIEKQILWGKLKNKKKEINKYLNQRK